MDVSHDIRQIMKLFLLWMIKKAEDERSGFPHSLQGEVKALNYSVFDIV